jgi:N-methylhydantoinase A
MACSGNDPIRIGIDIGGTFTDFVIYYPSSSEIKTFKILSTPNNPALAVLHGLDLLKIPARSKIIHGSTVATNALLERKGSKTALITTKGFKDILLIGRQNRPALYDWTKQKLSPIIPSELSFEVNERVDSEGNILIALEQDDIHTITQALLENEVQSVAISLLFSFLHPQHEKDIANRLRSENIFVSVSSEIIPEYREYERTSTTAVNAYVSPILDRYLSTLSSAIPNSNMQVMQSNGGMINLDRASKNGVRCILSGPAGGIIGAQYLASIAMQSKNGSTEDIPDLKLITFDMGGTSTDVSLINSAPTLTKESSIGGCPISIPVLDIHTIGAGGGSIAYTDQGGALRVGPESAGADPGPACYGRSEIPTVTDANIVLGRLVPEFFLGGSMPLDVDRAWKSIEHLATQLGMDTIHCAMGIITVANAHMEHALRVISVERGFDPRDFSLFSFGGAGGLHAVELARNLKMPRILISPYASVLSAFGMLAADVVFDYVQTVMLSNSSPVENISSYFQPLMQQGSADILSQGVELKHMNIQLFVDARYKGQSYELTIPFSPKWDTDFHLIHQNTYGYQLPEANIELVNIRVKAIGHTHHPIPPERPKGTNNPQNAYLANRNIIIHQQTQSVPCYQHEALEPGNIILGPALIIRPDTTVLIGEQDSILVDILNNLWINLGYITQD